MGYGLDPDNKNHIPHIWTFPIAYAYEDNNHPKRSDIERAINHIQSEVKQGMFINVSGGKIPPNFVIRTDKARAEGGQWEAKPNQYMQGKPGNPKEKSILHLGTKIAYGDIVHEFLHLLGVAHEHNRPDKEGEKRRQELRDLDHVDADPFGLLNRMRDKDKKRQFKCYGGFDSDSIMNNYFQDKNKFNKLSAGDVACIKEMYKGRLNYG